MKATLNNNLIAYTCKECGITIYDSKYQKRVFCSVECGVIWRRKRNTKECKFCGKKFISSPAHKRKFCSKDCFYEWRRKQPHHLIPLKPECYITSVCKQCDSSIYDLRVKNRKFCNNTCKAEWQREHMRGPNNPNWKDNKVDRRYRDMIEWRVWRTAVFERDNYICVKCKNGGRLEPHHLKSVQVHPELVYKVDNGITLCYNCHRELHKIVPSNDVVKVAEYPLSLLEAVATITHSVERPKPQLE